MRVYRLIRKQFVPRALKEVFPFFEAPENLARITPRAMGFEILTPPPVVMREGALIDYTIRILGVPVRWTSLIADYEPPHRFVDVQLRGPYTYWHHTHTFEESEGGTIIRDDVRYVIPFGWLGGLVHALVVRRRLTDIFDYRRSAIELILGSNLSLTEDGLRPLKVLPKLQ
jgi:ligand-binding SRPBCC domain-containing protein